MSDSESEVVPKSICSERLESQPPEDLGTNIMERFVHSETPLEDHRVTGEPKIINSESPQDNFNVLNQLDNKRERKLTDKGKAYQTETLCRKRQNAYFTLSKYKKGIIERLNLNCDVNTLENERNQLDQLKEELNLAQMAVDEILDTEEEKQASYHWFDVRDREYTECRMRISERIQMLERKSHRSVSVKSGHSGRSKHSTSSCASERSKGSARSLRVEAAAKSARLRAEMEFLNEETEVRRLQLMKDIAIANAEERAIKQVLDEENGVDNVDKNPGLLAAVKQEENTANFQLRENVASANQETEFRIDPLAKPFIPKFPQPVGMPGSEKQCLDINTATLRELVGLQAKQTELSSLLINQQKTSNLPVKEPPVFAGDPFDYPSFIAAFDSIICDKVSSNKDRLYFLEKYTKDKANDVVKGFLAVNSENAYSEARKLLDHRFGNPVHVAEAYKSRLRNWPHISDGDSTKLQAFSDFLIRCQEAAKTVGATGELDSTQALLQVGAKLPSYSGVKWCRHAHERRLKSGSNVSFSEFVKFVKEEADLANDPIFSPDLLKREKRKQAERDQKHKGGRGGSYKAGSFATNTQTGRNTDRPVVPCPLCTKNHNLDTCADFKDKNADNRRDFVVSKGLCFGCLKTGHLSRSCQSRLTCKECGKPHPTSLHGVKPTRRPDKNSQNSSRQGPIESPAKDSDCRATGSLEQAGENESERANASVCGSTGVSDGVTTSMIVPVVLHQRNNPDVEVSVYALLDNGSDSTFVKSSILRELGVEGVETSLQLNTMHGRTEIPVQRVEGLVVQRFDRKTSIALPKTYSRDSIPSRRDQIPTPEIAGRWPHLERIKAMIPPIRNDVDVGILIGCNCPKALKPQEVILGDDDDPYAIRTLLGWGIIGPVKPGEGLSVREDGVSTCNRVVTSEIGGTRLVNKFVVNQQTKEVINPFEVRRMFEVDFSERHQGDQAFSQEDRKFLEIVKKGIHHRADGHYEMPLPIKDKDMVLPNNRTMAYHRLRPLKKRFQSNETYRQHYVEFMNKVIQNGYAEKVPEDMVSVESNKLWYIPHHGVYHPKKPNKIRVVFDCSAQYKGESLNKHLLQGPDLTNNLTGVLCRFRREPVAFMCDIEAMFYQVKVPEEHRDVLRFLWWAEDDTSKEPQEYRMTVHLFGAASSPGCSNFALKTAADDNEESLGSAPAEFLRRDFYVDDGLKSVPTVEEAVDLVKSVKEMCKQGGFNLHKFTSNKKEVIQRIPELDRAEEIKNLDFDREALPMERALGIQWCIESDTFQFSIALKDRPCTRRGILSTVSSIFDPLGFVAPVLLEGKAILQELCRNSVGWDDPVSTEIQTQWLKWKSRLHELQNLAIPRCYKPDDFGRVVKVELHHFSDASTKGYGQCSYLRLINEDGKIHCAFVMGKSRVTPIKPVTIPRLELTAALCSVKVAQQLRQELDYHIDQEFFWTDSKVVLGYVGNESRRFHVFVANRVQEIQDNTSMEQWRYIKSEQNPADDASRGIKANELCNSRWISGSAFLWNEESQWSTNNHASEERSDELQSDDPEVKKSVALVTVASHDVQIVAEKATLESRMGYFSDWYRAKRAVAMCRKYVKRLQSRARKQSIGQEMQELNVSDLEAAERVLIHAAQASSFKTEMDVLKDIKQEDTSSRNFARKRKNTMKAYSALYKLDPFIDADGVLRVGGRLRRANLSDKVKYPVILPRKSHVTTLITRYFHERVSHQGKGITLNEIRANGFWIIGGSSVVAHTISLCVKCQKRRGVVQEQRMSDLPEDRLEDTPPFTNCAVDYFGPFIIRERRKELKRYGVLFTCMASRAVHLEIANSLETDSFINALRRFISRRGPIRQLRSDQGTNFVGARRELAEALAEMDHGKIKTELLKNQCNWFSFKMNVPSASHMGGVWERQIRTVRSVLSSLLQDNGTQLDDESLRTLMCEAEAIVNSRPLTVDQLTDPDSPGPLTPNHLLTMKPKVVLSPPGAFQSADVYCRKRWRRVQHLANEFWTRWRKEFLLSLQQRQKWVRPRRDLRVGDVVIIKDENLHRCAWQLGRVSTTYPSPDGQVRKVRVALADSCLDNKGRRTSPIRYLERPIQKLVLLMAVDQ